jgi:hypothetical protein
MTANLQQTLSLSSHQLLLLQQSSDTLPGSSALQLCQMHLQRRRQQQPPQQQP